MNTNDKKKSSTAKNKKNKAGKMFVQAMRGRLISTDFFSRHWITITLVVLMFIWYMTNNYECKTSMETIQKLEKRLEIVKTERIREQSMYMSRIRESSMRQLVKRHRLDLEIQDTPPYKIHYNTTEQPSHSSNQ